jgi:hypothetical protein
VKDGIIITKNFYCSLSENFGKKKKTNNWIFFSFCQSSWFGTKNAIKYHGNIADNDNLKHVVNIKSLFMANFDKERLNQIWNKGQVIRGENPNLYRQDIFGNVMFKPSYGKTSEMGWEVDHSKPQKLGGTDHLNNLQPMNSMANRQKGCKY